MKKQVSHVVVNIAGDSGDGVQLIGGQFSVNTALTGNDIATFPNFPAEIRAPQGTLHGVSGFQIHFSSEHIFTPGDQCDVLVAMNAASLKSQLHSLKRGGTIIANTDGFSSNSLRLAKYESNPLEDKTLDNYKIIAIDISKITKETLAHFDIGTKEKDRAKNMFVLGLLYWMYCRDISTSLDYINEKFHDTTIKESNVAALKAGYHFAETSEIFQSVQQKVHKMPQQKGKYRSITGNHALTIGLITASRLAGLPLFYGSYPITPASDLLHELSMHKNFGVITFQAEDEIAAIGAALGASYGGSLGVTGTSGPGMSLKTEAIGLAVMLEIPLLICNIQRGGPSTGLPTKTEQSDLMQAFYARNGECPLPIVAAKSPSHCFYAAIEAARIAVEHMTPVILLSDGYLANGSEVWQFPTIEQLIPIRPLFKTELKEGEAVMPYKRNENSVRPWIIPGTPHLTHRIGGLEKQQDYGNISYDPLNHEIMVKQRAAKIDAISQYIVPAQIAHGSTEGKVLLVGWGSVYGVLAAVTNRLHKSGLSIGHLHLTNLNPFPKNLAEILQGFEHILIPEMNNGQLYKILRQQFNCNFTPLNKIQGIPFNEDEIIVAINKLP